VTALSEGQMAVFKGVIKGHTNRVIAQSLGVAEKTVKAHITAILKKRRCKSRCELIVAHYTGARS